MPSFSIWSLKQNSWLSSSQSVPEQDFSYRERQGLGWKEKQQASRDNWGQSPKFSSQHGRGAGLTLGPTLLCYPQFLTCGMGAAPALYPTKQTLAAFPSNTCSDG